MTKGSPLPRVSLGHFPTPLEGLPRLARHLGIARLLVKRDDQTGLAGGGNKTRKLEFLVADALAQGADTLVTAGAAQSNHCRQTAAAAARLGLGCVLVLGGAPPTELPTGNLLLDTLLGAELRWSGPYRRGELLHQVVEELRAVGRRPYLIPYGGSNALGAAGYAHAMPELAEQCGGSGPLAAIDRIVIASSSGATQAGLVVGAHMVAYPGQILGIAIDKDEPPDRPYAEHLATLAEQTAALLGVARTFTPQDFTVTREYVGAGYGVVGELEREAIRLTARLEGLLLDPVYTGRAMGGLIDLIHRRVIGPKETVLFWHTGGMPALFAYAQALV
ncbi:MAG: D-cysteine desulfhydrase family protein [Ardenticatenia bacterium]|jgi:D-cysteine desulfhydrase|nr:MAG: D-cysteine desulfhydrase family protein [Ardenticatenia bacterium]